jgi:centrin-3
MKALGFDLPKQEILQLLQTHGVPQPSADSKGKAVKAQPGTTQRLYMSHATFQTLMASRIANRDPRTEILRAFDLFDADGKGSINFTDLRRVARELGEGLSDEELAAMIEEFDLDGDGAIGKEDFVNICLG